jgi:ABC-2 type transport system ATP-binding protein
MTPNVQVGLACRGLTKLFSNGRTGVRDIDFHVPYGSAFAIVGGNGAGKTTILNLCLGFLKPDAGEIVVGGVSIKVSPLGVRLQVAYVPEVARLYAHQSALQNIRFFNSLVAVKPTDDDILKLLGTLDFPLSAAKDPASTYSKGMRQKVTIAIGLLKGADVFLLDEPTSGLDPRSRGDLREIMRSLRENGKAILFSSHDLDSVYEVADRAAILRGGVIALECSGGALRDHDVDSLYGERSNG